MTRTGRSPAEAGSADESGVSGGFGSPSGQTEDLSASWSFVRSLTPGSADSAGGAGNLRLEPRAPRGWAAERALSADAKALLDLYVPLMVPSVRVLGHLGQSIDGFIAAEDGGSRNLSARENIVHLHRLRALFDAVVVGARTANDDDPKLTTRLVEGPNPARIVLDAALRSEPSLRLFHDGLAPTFLVCAAGAPARSYSAATRMVRLRGENATVREALLALNAEGLQRFFVEGGGVTVSRCLAEGVLDRLHVAVAPIVLGAGRPGVQMSGVRSLRDAWRPPCTHFPMGVDVLFDFELRPAT